MERQQLASNDHDGPTRSGPSKQYPTTSPQPSTTTINPHHHGRGDYMAITANAMKASGSNTPWKGGSRLGSGKVALPSNSQDDGVEFR